MSGIAYIKKHTGGSELYRFDTDDRVQNGYKPGVILIPHTDYECKILDLPPVSEDALDDAMQYHLRSVYPGPPNQTVFDYLLFKKAKKAAVLIANRDVVESYKNRWNGIPLSASLYIADSFVRGKGNQTVLFQEGDYIHVFEFKKGTLLRIHGIAEEDFPSFIESLKSKAGESGVVTLITVIVSDDIFMQISKAYGDNLPAIFERIPFSSRALNNIKPTSLFSRKKTSRRVVPLLFLIFGTVFLLLSIAVYQYRSLKRAEEDYAALSAQAEELKPRVDEIILLETEVEDLKGRITILTQKQPTDVYALLSRLLDAAMGDLEIESFILKNDSFQIEGYSKNPYELVKRIEDDGRFMDMKTYNVQPLSEKGVERFTFSGRYARE